MTVIRFETARDVFDAFPTIADDILARPSDNASLGYLKGLLASETPEDAITFCAYVLPRREAVWWACRCLRMLKAPPGESAALHAAEAWVRDPEEANQRAALAEASRSDSGAAATWAAFGAGWSGGNLADEGQPPVPAPPHLTAKAVRAAVLMAIAASPMRQRRERLGACVEEFQRVADDDIAEQSR